MIETMTRPPASVALDLADALNEPAPIAMCQMVRTVRELGPDAALDLAARALFIEATGGLPLPAKYNRKRTPGGVFFFLLKDTIDDDQYLRIFRRPRRPLDRQAPQAQEVAPQPVTQAQPKKIATLPAKPPTRPCAACKQQADVVGKFHFGPTGKQCLCGDCTDAGYVFGPSGEVMQLEAQAA